MNTILIVDVRPACSSERCRAGRLSCGRAPDGAPAPGGARPAPDVVLLDIGLPDIVDVARELASAATAARRADLEPRAAFPGRLTSGHSLDHREGRFPGRAGH
jgi:hypothetical protein